MSIEEVADYLVAPFGESPEETLEALIPRATPAGRYGACAAGSALPTR